MPDQVGHDIKGIVGLDVINCLKNQKSVYLCVQFLK